MPKNGCIIVKISYEKPSEIIDGLQHDIVVGIDLGVNNLAAITSNDGSLCSIVNGRPLKFINYRYNKDLAKLQKHRGSGEESRRYRRRLDAITRKRDFRVDDYLHKASRSIVNDMVRIKAARCFIGLGDDWKQRCNMKHHTKQMQNFQQTAFSRLVWMVKYKAALYGIEVTTIEEDHTSKCSYYDDEAVRHHSRYVGRRPKRGCFVTKDGRHVNADINGSLNIQRRGQGSHFGFHGSFFNPRIVTPDAPRGARECRVSGRIPNP